jgi:hypothetical protein
LNFFKDKEQSFLFTIKSNRKVSLEKKQFMSIKELEIPDGGLVVYLKEFGQVKVFKKMFKDEHRYYAAWCPNENELEQITSGT